KRSSPHAAAAGPTHDNCWRAPSRSRRDSPLHTAIYMAQPYTALGDTSHAIEWLRRHTPTADVHFQLHIRCDPPFDAIATDPRFRSLLTTPKPAPPHGC